MGGTDRGGRSWRKCGIAKRNKKRKIGAYNRSKSGFEMNLGVELTPIKAVTTVLYPLTT
jgi:hypothetical protein